MHQEMNANMEREVQVGTDMAVAAVVSNATYLVIATYDTTIDY